MEENTLKKLDESFEIMRRTNKMLEEPESRCYKCNKEITEKPILNKHGVNIMSIPDQEGVWSCVCLDCFAGSDLETKRYSARGIVCPLCGHDLDHVTIENHSEGGWFKALECQGCYERFNVRKFTQKEYQQLRNKLNREIATLKKANLKQ